MIFRLYDCPKFMKDFNKLVNKDNESETLIYKYQSKLHSVDEIYRRTKIVKKLQNVIETRTEHSTSAWNIGNMEAIQNMPFESITYFYYPTEQDKVFCKCMTDRYNHTWQVVTDINRVDQSFSNFSYPEFKNYLGYVMRQRQSDFMDLDQDEHYDHAQNYRQAEETKISTTEATR